MAMSAAAAERMVERSAATGLSLAVCHPLRLRPELAAIRDDSRSGANPIRLISGQFINRSPRAPLGAGAAEPSWTDNVLWHHLSHMLDFALWALDRPVTEVSGAMGAPDPRLGIPTEATLTLALDDGRIIVCTASYWGCSVYDVVLVSERDTYRFSQIHCTLADAAGVRSIPPRLRSPAFRATSPPRSPSVARRRSPAPRCWAPCAPCSACRTSGTVGMALASFPGDRPAHRRRSGHPSPSARLPDHELPCRAAPARGRVRRSTRPPGTRPYRFRTSPCSSGCNRL